jgi:hypothetical protein
MAVVKAATPGMKIHHLFEATGVCRFCKLPYSEAADRCPSYVKFHRFLPHGSEWARRMDEARSLPEDLRTAFATGVATAGRYLVDNEARFRPSMAGIMNRIAEELEREAGALAESDSNG